ncbi:MAG: hypothetical protein ACPLSP_05365 [Fervidicoccus fontis]
MSVSFTEDGIIAGMQKMGIGYLDENDINQMIDLAWKTAKIYLGEISKLI